MTEYTKDQLFGEIYLNENAKFTSTQWEEDKYITQQNGQIIDNKGNPFNLMTEKDNEWTLWIEPKKNTPTITKEEALKALYNGKRVKALEWEDKALELKNGQIMVNGAEPFNIMNSKEKEWIVVEDKNSKDESQDEEIAELKKMVKDLLSSQNDTKKDGRSKDVQDNTNELLKGVYGVTTPKEIEKQFKEAMESANSTKDVEKTICEYIPYCWIGGRSLGTTSVYYSNMRNIIKSIENEDYKDTALSLFLPPQRLYDTVQDKISDNKKDAIRNKKTFSPKSIRILIDKIKEKIEAGDYSDKPRQTDVEREEIYWKYTYLTIVTGRRQLEILDTLKILKNKKEFFFDGLVKEKENDKSKIKAFSLDEDFEFLRNTLKDVQAHIADEVKKTADKKGIKAEEVSINSKFNYSFNNALKRITNTSFTAKEWRDIYAEMLWFESGDAGSNIDKRDFKAKVLGHKYDGKLSATEHYDSWEAV